MESSILWRRLDHPGHDACLLLRRDDRWHLAGNAAFVEGGRPCRLSYRVICDAEWRTLAARVEGSIGDESFEIALRVHPALRRWKWNGAERRAVAGCTDVDLSFTPATNLLPIRRLGLQVGEEAPVRAAWLRLPELTLEPLEQVYRRTGDRTYRYESRAGRPDDPFAVELAVDGEGFVTHYPGLWQAEETAIEPAVDHGLAGPGRSRGR